MRAGAVLATVVAAATLAAALTDSTPDDVSRSSASIPQRTHRPPTAGRLGELAPWPSSLPRPRAVVRRPIDERQQTELEFGERSHWGQPWRAYLDTVPAARLREGVGVNFNVAPDEADAAARLLAFAGIRRARVELGWDAFDFTDPTRLSDPEASARILRALVRHRIRPLVLLNGNDGAPCPTRFFDAHLVSPARAGDRTVRLDAATAAMVAPGRTGLNAADGKAADTLFTAVGGDGVAILSKPLAEDLSAGDHPAATLRYAPFEAPQRADGTPNPTFETTLQGWLSYVTSAVRAVRRSVGSTRFDVEIWNELSFGSDFLSAETYYNPAPDPGLGDVTEVLLDRTVSALRDPALGLGSVGIANGFASERPWDSGATSPVGLTANAKHPYAGGPRRFPGAAEINGVMPVDALGHPDGVSEGVDRWRDRFIPHYTAFFPEYYLSAIQTEHLIRDVSPLTTDIYGTPHGRRTHPRGGPPPRVWVTEWNLDPGEARSPVGSGPLSTRDRRVQGKALLRALLAYINKGVRAFYVYAAKDDRLGIVENSFFRAVQRSGGYPGDRAGGTTVTVLRRLSAAFRGPRSVAHTRRLRLLALGDYAGRRQFAGDGTHEHPALYDRDVVAFLPFQVSGRRFVIGTYVMTRDVAASLTAERFAFAIGGLRRCDVAVGATDPLAGHRIPVRRVSCSRRRLVVALDLTDAPRLLTIRLRSSPAGAQG